MNCIFNFHTAFKKYVQLLNLIIKNKFLNYNFYKWKQISIRYKDQKMNTVLMILIEII